MPKIALVKITPIGYYDDYEEIITAISEWEEVTKEELDLLKKYRNRTGGYTIIEFVDNQREKIDFAVKAQLKYIREEEKRKEAEKKAKDEKALTCKTQTRAKET